ncbi:MAG: hypothetical protein ACFFBV_09855 [Promethearchaeota archaeon]
MKNLHKSRLFILIFGILLIFGLFTFIANAQEGPPTQEQAFGSGNTFDQNYWDTNIFNNSYWDHPDVRPEVSWENNTWNMKWMKEGNFEMGMLAFINKTTWEDGKEIVYTTPAQMWWQHAHLSGSEIFIASMHSAWFGFGDSNSNGYYDIGEEVNPYFFMGASTEDVRNAGIMSNPKTKALPLTRVENGSIITYKWGYNYSDIIFYVPEIDRAVATPYFKWGFNYSDPGTYVNGSHHIGNVTHFSYDYTLEIDTSRGVATLYQDYESGEIAAMVYRDNSTDSWAPASFPDDHWVPDDFAMSLGTYSFIWAGQDWALTTPNGTISRANHTTGLSEVRTTLGGVHAFDFKFSQKPQYSMINKSGTIPNIYNASYECLDVVHDAEFIHFVQGMTELVGEFGRLIIGYVINQTNHFTFGIPFEEAYNSTDPENMAAFFVTCYPEYGMNGGGKLIHDPVYTAYFDVYGEELIPGYHIEILTVVLIVGITLIVSKRKKIT